MGFFGNYRALHELQINGRNPEEDENQNRTADEPDDPAPAEPQTPEAPPAEEPPADTPPAEDPPPTDDEPEDPAGGEIPETPEDYEIPDGAEPPAEEPPAEDLPPTDDEPEDPAGGEIPETQDDDPEAGTEPAPTGDEPADPDIPAGDGDYTDTGDTGAETPPVEGEEGTDPDIPAGDANYTDDGAGDTGGDPGAGGGDPNAPADGAGGDGTMPADDDTGDGTIGDGADGAGGATSASQIANDLKSLEDEIFGDLSDQQKDIRDNELKSSYIALYNTIDEAEKRINNIVKNENTGKVLEFVTRKMNELKQLIHHNLTVVYPTRTYVENQTALQECIAIMNIICTMLESIAKEDEKHKEE